MMQETSPCCVQNPTGVESGGQVGTSSAWTRSSSGAMRAKVTCTSYLSGERNRTLDVASSAVFLYSI